MFHFSTAVFPSDLIYLFFEFLAFLMLNIQSLVTVEGFSRVGRRKSVFLLFDLLQNVFLLTWLVLLVLFPTKFEFCIFALLFVAFDRVQVVESSISKESYKIFGRADQQFNFSRCANSFLVRFICCEDWRAGDCTCLRLFFNHFWHDFIYVSLNFYFSI